LFCYTFVFTIRKFQPTDMFSVIKLASETLTEHYNPSLFNYFYETFPQGFLVADRLHKIIGFVVGLEVVPGTLKIPMLAVKKEHRKQGIGSALLNNFLEEAALQNIKQAELEVRKDNKQAIKFYQKYGFEIVETISKFYQNGEDAYIMRRAI
jgi:ribosomal-protein-alanine N-acetyltransferase